MSWKTRETAAAGLVDSPAPTPRFHVPDYPHLLPILQLRRRAEVVGAPHDAAHLSLGVTQREIPMTTAVDLETRHLSLDPYSAQPGFDQLPRVPIELGNGPRAVRRRGGGRSEEV